MKTTRRSALAVALVGIGLALQGKAYALFLRSGIASIQTPITSFTLNNETGSPESPMWSTQLAHPFEDNQIASGTMPIFQINGVTIPFSAGTPRTWASGCVAHLPGLRLLLGGNVKIPANGSVTVYIYSGGTVPAPSARSPSDFTAANLSWQVTLLDGDTEALGNYAASLNTAISAQWLAGQSSALANSYVWSDGPAGKCYVTDVDCFNGTTPEGSGTGRSVLRVRCYVWSLQDSSGNFGGIEVMACSTLPRSDITSSLKAWKSYTAMQFYAGATLIRDMVTQRSNTQSISWSSGNIFTATGVTIETGAAIRLTTSGALPDTCNLTASISGTTLTTGTITAGALFPNTVITGGGVAAGTLLVKKLTSTTWQVSISQTVALSAMTTTMSDQVTYFCSAGASAGIPNQMIIGTSSGGTTGPQGTAITPINGGSGAIVAVAYPYDVYYDRQYFAGTNGQYDFIQGGGSVSAASVSIVNVNMAYWMATGMMPVWDMTIGTVPSYPTTYSYYANTAAFYDHDANSTSDTPTLGIFPQPYATHVYTQAPADLQNVIVGGLIGGNMPVNLRDTTYGQILPMNNGTNGSGTAYSNMGPLLPISRFDGTAVTPTGDSTSDLAVASLTVIHGVISDSGGSHRGAFSFWPYLWSGRPEFAEQIAEMGNCGIMQNVTSGSIGVPTTSIITTSEYLPGGNGSRIIIGPDSVKRFGIYSFIEERQFGWNYRDNSAAAGALPQGHAFFAPVVTYLTNVANDNMDFMNAVINAAPTTYAANIGLFWVAPQQYIDGWQFYYTVQALSLDYGFRAYANTLNFTNGINKFWAHIVNTFGIYPTTSESLKVCMGAPQSALATSDLYLATNNGLISWTNDGSANFTMNTAIPGATAWTPAINDVIFFVVPETPSASETPIPASIAAIQGGNTINTPPPSGVYLPFYIISVSGSGSAWTIQVSQTLGGSAIVNTDAQTNRSMWNMMYSPPNSFSNGASQNTGYPVIMYRGMLLSKAFGATMDATALAAMAASQIPNSSLLSNPKYAFAA